MLVNKTNTGVGENKIQNINDVLPCLKDERQSYF